MDYNPDQWIWINGFKKNPKKGDRILIRSTDLIHFFQYLGMDRVDRSGNTSLQLIALRFNVRSTNDDTPEAIQVICKLVIVVNKNKTK